ncbi:MAG: tetratricopeptide repeat protein [Deltaproteobacteria bacterium]|nr:tetratricopeptide repeat protein [Deltaproteobacteria bacterium]
MSRFSFFFSELIALCVFALPACHPAAAVLDPDSYSDDIQLPHVATSYGNPYTYEHKIRADVLLARDEMAEAISEYELAIAGDPADSWLRIQFADVLIQEGDLERARNHVAKAILFDPANGKAWTTAATLQMQLENPSEAIASARYGSRIDPTDITALRWLGDYYAQHNDSDSQKKALHYYQMALIRSKTEPELYLAAGKTAFNLQLPDLTTQYLVQYIALYGANLNAVLEISKKCRTAENAHIAIELLETLLQRDVLADEIRQELIRRYLEAGQYLDVVRTVLSFNEDPITPRQIAVRTDWLLKADAPWEARDLIVEHFSAAPTHPTIRYQLAKIEWMLRRNEVALAILNNGDAFPDAYMDKVNRLRDEITNGLNK